MAITKASFIVYILTLLSIQTPLMCQSENRPGLSLKETFDIYVRSIWDSDLKGLFSTVSEKEAFFFLTSGGRLIATRDGYYKFHVVADICTPISRTFQDSGSDLFLSAEQKFLFDTLKNRRTVRKFKPTPVPRADLMKILDAARSLGYGTGFFTSYFPESRMKEFFRIPDRYNLICFTPIGIPEAWPQIPAKKALSDIVVFDKFE